MKRPDLLMLIAIWQFLTAFAAIVGLGVIALIAFPTMLGAWNESWGTPWGLSHSPMMGVFGLSIVSLVLVCYTAIGMTGGIGLLMGKEWGRIASIVHNALILVCFPVGTALGILSIIYLNKVEVKDYFIPGKPTA